MHEKFCPFINDICRRDCTFYNPMTYIRGITTCTLVGRLDEISSNQIDILSKIDNKKSNL